MNQIITIRDRRQITLPRLFLNKFDLDVGDKLIMRLEADQIKIEPIKSRTVDLLSKIQEIVKESNIPEKELQKSGQTIRRQLVKAYYQEK
ncbi:MAG: AbrB/MazE/SpoVT family DNA-binding domain-containing protein [Candidatus Roizmanbacteria bacterium]|nr:AbrB/MazE/SpoVT family DNA-binding domain-containing protein [Candidatus Roizmanbacteria bacterium]